MKVYTYSEARQKLAKVLDLARTEEIMIKKRSGEIFSVVYQRKLHSPFDVKGVTTSVTKQEILDAVDVTRSRGWVTRLK